eukprot:6207353-Pleurochrysis_carterae.AAC.2
MLLNSVLAEVIPHVGLDMAHTWGVGCVATHSPKGRARDCSHAPRQTSTLMEEPQSATDVSGWFSLLAIIQKDTRTSICMNPHASPVRLLNTALTVRA